MHPPTTPHDREPEVASDTRPRHADGPTEPSGAHPLARMQMLCAGYLARHPALLKVLEALGWNNPGAGMNP